LVWLRARLAHERRIVPPPLSVLESLTVAAPADAAYRAMAEAEAAGTRASDDSQSAVRAWGAAVQRWRAAGEPFPLAQSLLRFGFSLVEQQDRDAAADALAEARTIADSLGAAPLSREIESLVRRARLPARAATGEVTDAGGARLPALTHREVDVLRLVAEGQSNSQIGAALFISPKTVSVHITNVLSKLGVTNRREAAAIAYRAGLLESESS